MYKRQYSFPGKGKQTGSQHQILSLIHISPHIGKPNAIRVKPYIPETVYKQVEAFKKYMDSLSRNDKKKYEEILGQRPGLPDSILLFEKLYLSQSKNKNGN